LSAGRRVGCNEQEEGPSHPRVEAGAMETMRTPFGLRRRARTFSRSGGGWRNLNH